MPSAGIEIPILTVVGKAAGSVMSKKKKIKIKKVHKLKYL